MSTEIVKYQSFDDIKAIAQTFALTGYFDAKGSNPVEIAKAVTKILAGQEMGFGPFASINGIHIIQGRPSVSAGLMATAVKASAKYDYRVRESTSDVCRIEYFERTSKGMESLGVAVFTLADAKQAGTQNLQKFPADMLFARCMSRGVRRFCPDVFGSGSVYTPEELGATVNEEGEYVDTTAKVVEGNGKQEFEVEEPESEPYDFKGAVRHIDRLGKAAFGDQWQTTVKEYAAQHNIVWKTATEEELEACIAWLEAQTPEAEPA